MYHDIFTFAIAKIRRQFCRQDLHIYITPFLLMSRLADLYHKIAKDKQIELAASLPIQIYHRFTSNFLKFRIILC